MKQNICKGCGALLTKSANGYELYCEFCGSTYELERDNTVAIKELTDAKVMSLLIEAEKHRKASDRSSEIQTLAKALELSPDTAIIWVKMGRVYRECGLTDKALDCYNRAIAIKPNEGHAYCNIGAVYLVRGDYANACKYYEKGFTFIDRNTDREYPILLGNYALAVGKNGDKKRAAALINEAERLGYANAKVVKKSLGIGLFSQ